MCELLQEAALHITVHSLFILLYPVTAVLCIVVTILYLDIQNQMLKKKVQSSIKRYLWICFIYFYSFIPLEMDWQVYRAFLVWFSKENNFFLKRYMFPSKSGMYIIVFFPLDLKMMM